jgi:hypothetical protein
MLHRNDIFLNTEFVQKLMLLIPSKVSNYWEISIIDVDKIEGGIRYNQYDEIDAIYIYMKTKFMEIDDPRCVIKFNAEKDIFTFDSIYSQYDPIREKLFLSEEYRYDSNMNIIGEYRFTSECVVQYKNGKKLKEYFMTSEIFPLVKLNELDNAGIIKQEIKAVKDIIASCFIVGETIKYYHIR